MYGQYHPETPTNLGYYHIYTFMLDIVCNLYFSYAIKFIIQHVYIFPHAK